MVCGSSRAKAEDIGADQKWDFISLNDFKSTSFFGYVAYAWLWASLFISVAVYGVDTFTAVNLLAFDRWSGAIEPAIPLNISKWIFSACIIASWVNLGFEYLRAIRVIRRGAVAESYLDSLAVRLQCIRFGEVGRGWRRFLVFAELTKSKKGAEYVALFTYFSFQSWIRIIFCQGPRQVVNALTLYAVFKAQLLPTDAANVGSALGQFFQKIGILADQEHQQAVILCGMLFTLVIWVFGALSLILAILFYILFLWHYIPNADGGLSGYCERKVNQRLAKIVSAKVNLAIEEEERKRRRADAKALKKGEKTMLGRQATLPTLFDAKDGDKLPMMPMLNRNDTTTTLPTYTSRPGTPSGQPTVPAFELNQLEKKRPPPLRNLPGTSFGSNAPLISNASDMGYEHESPAPPPPSLDRNGFPIPGRSVTSNSQNGPWNSLPQPRLATPLADRGYTSSPVSYTDNRPSLPSHTSNGSQESIDNYGRPMPRPIVDRSNPPAGPPPNMGRRPTFDPNPPSDRNSPAPFPQAEYGRNPQAPFPPSEYGRSSSAPFPQAEYGRSSSAPFPQAEYGRSSPAPSRGPNPDFARNSPAPGTSGRGPRPPSPTSGNQDYARNSPAPGSSGRGPRPPSPTSSRYQAYNPDQRSASSATPAPYPPSSTPGPGPRQYRNVTEPAMGSRGPPQGAGDYFGNAVAPQRSDTSQGGRAPNFSRLTSPTPYNGGDVESGSSAEQGPYGR